MKLTNTTTAGAWNAVAIVSVANIPASAALEPPPQRPADLQTLPEPASLEELVQDRVLALAAERAHGAGGLETRPYADYRRRRLSSGD